MKRWSRRVFTLPSVAGATCPASEIVAFSVEGQNHVSGTGPTRTTLSYATTHTSEGGGWTAGGGTFTAPCKGLYTFSVSFVKDSYYNGGTTDDVFVYIVHNGVEKGFAWAGEQPTANREGTSYTVALMLNAGDRVHTAVASDSGTRHLGYYSFTGYLVRRAC